MVREDDGGDVFLVLDFFSLPFFPRAGSSELTLAQMVALAGSVTE